MRYRCALDTWNVIFDYRDLWCSPPCLQITGWQTLTLCVLQWNDVGFAILLVPTVLLGILAKSVDNEKSGSRNL
jgi:hypothetical protein